MSDYQEENQEELTHDDSLEQADEHSEEQHQEEETIEEPSNEDQSEEQQEESPNVLNMSDEEFLKSDLDFEEDSQVSPEGAETEPTKEEDKPTEETQEPGAKGEGVNYEEAYKEILAPFKANGKEIKVDSIDEAKSLMQMGANYSKKMAALKPHLKIVKTLEKAKLLDEGKLNFLIDVANKDKAAITKLLKDSNIDPLDLDTEEDSNYKSKNHSVTDQEYELDQVLDEIKESPAYNRTIDVLGTKWDEKSREHLVANPALIKAINTHVEDGFFDKIVDKMEKEKLLGRLDGMTDIEAYRAIGDKIVAEEGYPSSEAKQAPKQAPTQPKQPSPKQLQATQRKKAAAPTKSRPATKAKSLNEYNPLALSDDEFEKLMSDKFI